MQFSSLNLLTFRRRLSIHLTRTICAVTSIVILSVAGNEPLAHETRAAQSGGIKGQVVADITDRRQPLAGVVVSLSSERVADKKLQTVSDFEGRYNFTGLTAGDYSVSVELQGFKKYEQKIVVQIEATGELNILLQPIALSATVPTMR